jgi:excisionase family DNA binding protein
MSEPLMTAHEVAALLRLRPVTVYAAAAKGLIPCVRLWKGGRRGLIRFRRSEVESWLRTKSLAGIPGHD